MRLLIALILATTTLLLTDRVFARTIILSERNTVTLDLPFDGESTRAVVEGFQKLNGYNDKYLVLISPGGNVVDGLSMIDTINGLGYKVNTITLFAASMGFITVQTLGKRYITPHGVLMSHRASGGVQGQFPRGELESRLNFWLRRIESLDQIVVDRSNGKLTLQKYQQLYQNEAWCEGVDCVNLGLADEVVTVKCGPSLIGTVISTISVPTFLGAMSAEVERSKCPLLPGYKLVKEKSGAANSDLINIAIKQYLDKLNKNTLPTQTGF